MSSRGRGRDALEELNRRALRLGEVAAGRHRPRRLGGKEEARDIRFRHIGREENDQGKEGEAHDAVRHFRFSLNACLFPKRAQRTGETPVSADRFIETKTGGREFRGARVRLAFCPGRSMLPPHREQRHPLTYGIGRQYG